LASVPPEPQGTTILMARPRLALRLLTIVLTSAAVVGQSRSVRPATPGVGGAAYRIINLDTGHIVSEARPEIVDAPVAPGSVYKIATLLAASETGLLDQRTAIVCRRTINVAGTSLTCIHPDLHRALTPVDALAQSCNFYFATVAGRLSRPALDAVLARLGLSPVPSGTPTALGALGLGGVRAAPGQLLQALVRLVGPVPSFRLAGPTRQLLVDGLRAAARDGTASAMGSAGFVALAKTGTAPMPGGGFHGIVVAVLPDARPRLGIVVLVPGGAGSDAAEVAAELLTNRTASETGTSPIAPSRGPIAGEIPVRVGSSTAGGRRSIRTVQLEDYVAAVVAGESEDGMQPAAREALAIAARTFALANLGRHASEGFDLCDLTHCQAIARATALAERAARATAGTVLFDGDRPAEVYFSAWCGGHTERPSAVWPGAIDRPFLPAQPDPACAGRAAWTSEIAAPKLLDALRGAGLKGTDLRSLSIAARTGSGRAAMFEAVGMNPPEVLAGAFRTSVGRLLGWQVLKSTLVDLHRSAAGYVFVGRGSGHGVGLCLAGADDRASRGADARTILAFYYPGLRVGPLRVLPVAGAEVSPPARTDIRVLLPDSALSDLPVVRALASRSLDELVSRISVTPPGRLTIRFHTTTEDFRRATRQPWWVAGSSERSVIDLLPLAVLRRRGILDSTLRHEMVHVLTARALAGRPMWVREGLAAYFAGESHPVPSANGAGRSARNSCPEDREFSVNAGEAGAGDAYRRAAACVERALARGQTWRDLR
jgi:SpoIID/LytB domain protein